MWFWVWWNIVELGTSALPVKLLYFLAVVHRPTDYEMYKSWTLGGVKLKDHLNDS